MRKLDFGKNSDGWRFPEGVLIYLAEDEKDRQRHGVTHAIFIPLGID
jgi:hypothetical protein